MYFKITNGSVSYGSDTILENIEFEIKDKEKIAIVGRNGCGKTTLLNAILGNVELEEGSGEKTFNVSKSGNFSIGFLKQVVFEDDNIKMIDEILKVFKNILSIEKQMEELLNKMQNSSDSNLANEYSRLTDYYEKLGGYTYKKEYSIVIKNFGFSLDDYNKKLKEFSGGQRTKIAFIKLLLQKPDVLILDEPTNHLDLNTIEWLEDYLKNYKSALIIVSHDRMFLNKIVNKVYEIEYGETREYIGNYSDFERQKKENYEKQIKDHNLQQKEIERITRLIERFRYKATKAKMVQSKIKMLERMKRIDLPNRYDLKSFNSNFQPDETNNRIALYVRNLNIGYNKPLANLNFELAGGKKLAIIGGNGTGKSTFLKTLMQLVNKISGSFNFGNKCQIGYFDQQVAIMGNDNTVYEDFYNEFPNLNETQIRTALGAFQFDGENVFKEVKNLSGGEKVRLALAKMLKKKPNVLILDEPTNHMDIVGKETLENMLKAFKGTIIFVSHDRYFVNKIADCLLVFENDQANFYDMNYLEYKDYQSNILQNQEEKTESKDAKEKKKFTTPLKEKSRLENKILKIEEKMSLNSLKIEELNNELLKPEVYSDYIKVQEIQENIDKINLVQNDLSLEWLELSEKLENC